MVATPCLMYIRSKYWVGKTEQARLGQIDVSEEDRTVYYTARYVCVPLYRKYDGNLDMSKVYFNSLAEKVRLMFPKDVVLPSTEWLTYAEDMSAMFIAHDYDNTLALVKRFGVMPRPDLRPMGEINDASVQNVYVVDLQDIGDVWTQDKKNRKAVRMKVRHFSLVPTQTMHDKVIRGYDPPGSSCDWEEKYLLYEPPIQAQVEGRVEAVKVNG